MASSSSSCFSSLFCGYSRHLCHRERLSGFDFCSAHILDDKNAPFKQCSYPIKTTIPTAATSAAGMTPATPTMSACFSPGMPPPGSPSLSSPFSSLTTTTRRCHRPANKNVANALKTGPAANANAVEKRESYCPEHTRRALIARQIVGFAPPMSPASTSTSKTLPTPTPMPTPTPTPQSRKRRAGSTSSAQIQAAVAAATAPPSHASAHKYIKDLAHYEGIGAVVKKESEGAHSSPKKQKNDCIVFDRLAIPSASQRAFDGGFSEIDDVDDESVLHTVEAAWRGDGEESDAESVDSDMEDPLKHAGAYSAEEVIRIMRDKLIRLQKLYIDQFQRLQHLFKEERRQYCHSVRREREEQLMSVHSQPKETSEEVASYEAVRALNHYNKPQGLEAVLYQMLMEKRQRAAAASGGGHLTETTMASASNASLPKCSFNLTTNTKCGEVAVPMSKFCMKHVMSDSTQVLFRACGVTTTADDGPCETPVPDLFESTTCVFHTQLQGSIYEDKEPELAEAKKEPAPPHPNPKCESADEPPQAIVVPIA